MTVQLFAAGLFILASSTITWAALSLRNSRNAYSK